MFLLRIARVVYLDLGLTFNTRLYCLRLAAGFSLRNSGPPIYLGLDFVGVFTFFFALGLAYAPFS